MTARDELAELIGNLLYVDSFYGDMFYGGQNRKTLAELLLAAGYRKPRTITTAEELDALPNGTVVMDCHGEVARKLVYGWRVLVSESGFDAWLSDPLEETCLPATVLHEGAQS